MSFAALLVPCVDMVHMSAQWWTLLKTTSKAGRSHAQMVRLGRPDTMRLGQESGRAVPARRAACTPEPQVVLGRSGHD